MASSLIQTLASSMVRHIFGQWVSEAEGGWISSVIRCTFFVKMYQRKRSHDTGRGINSIDHIEKNF